MTEGIIKTRDQGQSFYGNDMSCVWEIDAAETRRIQLTIKDLDLQWNPEYSTCTGYDHLEINEGNMSDKEMRRKSMP